MKADSGRSAPQLPASEHLVQALPHLGQIGKPSIQVSLLAAHERADVGAWRAAGPLDRDDLPDLIQAEAESLRLPDEREQVQRGLVVDPVARGGAAGRSEDARLLVQPEGLPGDPRTLRHLTDQQPVLAHEQTVNPAPRGKVKRRPRPSGADWQKLAIRHRLPDCDLAVRLVCNAIATSQKRG